MLRPIETEFTSSTLGRPKGWDNSQGECVGLPVAIDPGDVYPTFYSWWKPTLKDRIKILFGFNIRLALVSGTHPPVSLEVENTKEVVMQSPYVHERTENE